MLNVRDNRQITIPPILTLPFLEVQSRLLCNSASLRRVYNRWDQILRCECAGVAQFRVLYYSGKQGTLNAGGLLSDLHMLMLSWHPWSA